MLPPTLTNEYETAILDLIEHAGEYTTSDLQGQVTLLVNTIMVRGYEILSEQEKQ